MVTQASTVKAKALSTLPNRLCFDAKSRSFTGWLLRKTNNVIASRLMPTEEFDAALDRLELALEKVEGAIALQSKQGGEAGQELAILKVRHRKLKETVAQELQQLDLLLAGLPK